MYQPRGKSSWPHWALSRVRDFQQAPNQGPHLSPSTLVLAVGSDGLVAVLVFYPVILRHAFEMVRHR